MGWLFFGYMYNFVVDGSIYFVYVIVMLMDGGGYFLVCFFL